MAKRGKKKGDINKETGSGNDGNTVTLICFAALHLEVRQMFLFLKKLFGFIAAAE